MYPDFSYLLHDLFGTQPDNWTAIIKTFGFFLFLSFICSGFIFYSEFLRKEKQGVLKPITVDTTQSGNFMMREILINTAIAFFFGYKIPFVVSNFDQFKTDPAAALVSGGGNIFIAIVAAVVVGTFFYFQSKKMIPKSGIIQMQPHQKIGDIVTYAALFGILGAKVFAVLENLPAFFEDPIGTFFSGSGLTVLGGFIFATIAIFFLVRKLGLPFLDVADAGAPAVITGYLVGRLGCQFSGDGDWGRINDSIKPDWFIFPDWAWSYGYPNNVSNRGQKMTDCAYQYCSELIPGVWPTPVYEVLMLGIIFGILWYFRTRINVSGVLFFMYFLLYGIMRFLIEFIRVNDRYEFLGFEFSQAQYISILFWFIGIGGMWYLNNKSKNPAVSS